MTTIHVPFYEANWCHVNYGYALPNVMWTTAWQYIWDKDRIKRLKRWCDTISFNGHHFLRNSKICPLGHVNRSVWTRTAYELQARASFLKHIISWKQQVIQQPAYFLSIKRGLSGHNNHSLVTRNIFFKFYYLYVLSW